jgi:DNA-binding transcriptional LysR family regulator
MRVFARVARLGSFAGAARELRLSTTAVSRRVAELEDGLGVKLLQLTTRRIGLSEEGAAYLDRCERILEEIDDLESSIAAQRASPSGRLRVTAGVSFGQEQLVPLLPAFLEQHPKLSVDLDLSDRYVDLVAEGFDVAIRIGRLPDSTLVARRLAPSRVVLCASPAYLERAGTPGTPEDLARHACVIDRNTPLAWELAGENGPYRHVPEGRLQLNGAHVMRDVLVRGLGIGPLPSFVAGRSLASGELVEVLADFPLPLSSVFAVYPLNRHLSTKVRIWIDHLREQIGDPPVWERRP